MSETIYAVLLNYKGWADTIACLESLFNSKRVNLRVIVCDNDSGDGSLDRIEAWAKGELEADRPEQHRLARMFGHFQRPINVKRMTREEADSGQSPGGASLILVDNAENIGFAAGNNVGLRLALAQPDMRYAWLLNNDTLVEPDCLASMRDELCKRSDNAVCGSVIHFFDRPEVIQALGGNRFNRFTGVAAQSEGRFMSETEPFCFSAIAKDLAYVSGCSMLLPRRFLEEVGLMDESFFLYYEEIDWFTRAGKRFPICIAADAHLYHREGAAIGSPGWNRGATAFADFHLYRSRFLFMKKHHFARLPMCFLAAFLDTGKCLLRGRFANARSVFKAMTQTTLMWRTSQ